MNKVTAKTALVDFVLLAPRRPTGVASTLGVPRHTFGLAPWQNVALRRATRISPRGLRWRLWAISIGCVSLSLACGGTRRGPADDATALEWARITLPPGATDFHYIGDKGIDFSVELQFVVPADADLSTLYDQVGCVPSLEGTVGDTEPFGYRLPEADWLVESLGPGRAWCTFDADPIEEHRGLRVGPPLDGHRIVQLGVWGH